MANIEVLPSPILRKVTSPVTKITQNTKSLIDNMHQIMFQHNFIGLAANQIGISKSILVWNFIGQAGHIINPVIQEFSDELATDMEGCGSLPYVTLEVTRPKAILMTGLNSDGNKITIFKEDYIARILQHELDHLAGIVMIDRAELDKIPPYLLQYRIDI